MRNVRRWQRKGIPWTSGMNPREKAFFDDPSAYPEYSLLIKRESLNHAIRIGLHRHRFVMYCCCTLWSTANIVCAYIQNSTDNISAPCTAALTSKQLRAFLPSSMLHQRAIGWEEGRHGQKADNASIFASVSVASLVLRVGLFYIWIFPRETVRFNPSGWGGEVRVEHSRNTGAASHVCHSLGCASLEFKDVDIAYELQLK